MLKTTAWTYSSELTRWKYFELIVFMIYICKKMGVECNIKVSLTRFKSEIFSRDTRSI